MKRKIYYALPRIVTVIIILSLAFCIFNKKLYKDQSRIIVWDVMEYYIYVPAVFIHKDVTLKFTENDSNFSDKFWPIVAPNGGKVPKMSMGMSFLYAPFFLITHFLSPLMGFEADGFSAPYRLSIQLGCIIYLAFGLFFLRKILQRFFNPVVTAITLLSVVAGTNLFYYVVYESGMAHPYNFSLFALFVWLTLKWHESPSIKLSIFVGLVIGIISLIRPSNSLIFIFFILYGVSNAQSFLKQYKRFVHYWYFVSIILIFAFSVWLPQLMYWKYITGNWLFYSYDNQGFYFNDPQIINGLLSYRKGWFLYTPIAIFMLSGLIFMYQQRREWFWAIGIFIALHFYIVVSWWTWWYGGSFGLRPMIETYALLAIPMAFFIKKILDSRYFIRLAGILLLGVLIIHSLFQTLQYYHGALHYDSMTKEAYWDSFLRVYPSARFGSLLKAPDYDKALRGLRDE